MRVVDFVCAVKCHKAPLYPGWAFVFVALPFVVVVWGRLWHLGRVVRPWNTKEYHKIVSAAAVLRVFLSFRSYPKCTRLWFLSSYVPVFGRFPTFKSEKSHKRPYRHPTLNGKTQGISGQRIYRWHYSTRQQPRQVHNDACDTICPTKDQRNTHVFWHLYEAFILSHRVCCFLNHRGTTSQRFHKTLSPYTPATAHTVQQRSLDLPAVWCHLAINILLVKRSVAALAQLPVRARHPISLLLSQPGIIPVRRHRY